MIRWGCAGALFAIMFLIWACSLLVDPYQSWDETRRLLRPGVAQALEGAAAIALLFTGLVAATLYSFTEFLGGEENRRGWRLWLTAPVLLFFAATSVWRWGWIVFHVLR